MAAQSDFYKERAAAGRQLAAFAGDPVADDVLAQLLRDVEDSSVTSETVMALLARRDTSGMRVVAQAFGPGDASIVSEVVFSLGAVLKSSEERAEVESVCRSLTGDQDEGVRRGARDLLDRLAAPDFGYAADVDSESPAPALGGIPSVPTIQSAG